MTERETEHGRPKLFALFKRPSQNCEPCSSSRGRSWKEGREAASWSCDPQRVVCPLCEQGSRIPWERGLRGPQGFSNVPDASGCCSRSLPCDEPVPWALDRPTVSCCLRQRRARATEAVLKKRAVLQAGVNTATTLVEAKRARQVLAAHDGALSGCCSSCLSHVANWGAPTASSTREPGWCTGAHEPRRRFRVNWEAEGTLEGTGSNYNGDGGRQGPKCAASPSSWKEQGA